MSLTERTASREPASGRAERGKAPKPTLGRRLRRRLVPYGFIAPAFIGVFLVLAYPVAYGIWLSVTDTDLFGQTEFVAFELYADMFASPRFHNALLRSVTLVFGSVIFGVALSMMIALTLDRVRWGGRFFRTLVLIPYLVSGVAASVMWRFLFSSTGGLVDPLFETFGFEPISWLGHSTRAMVVLIGANVWFIGPFATLIIYAGLKTVDQDLYEAAAVDGASEVNKFRYITLPGITPQLGLALVWLSFASFNIFDVILPMTGGGPGRATEVLALVLYQLGFQELDFHSSAVVMVVLLAINVILSAIYLKVFPSTEK